MSRMITVERILEQRDVDAALYLLSRVLNVEARPEYRRKVNDLRTRIQASRKISPEDRHTVVATYREVIG